MPLLLNSQEIRGQHDIVEIKWLILQVTFSHCTLFASCAIFRLLALYNKHRIQRVHKPLASNDL